MRAQLMEAQAKISYLPEENPGYDQILKKFPKRLTAEKWVLKVFLYEFLKLLRDFA